MFLDLKVLQVIAGGFHLLDSSVVCDSHSKQSLKEMVVALERGRCLLCCCKEETVEFICTQRKRLIG